MYIKEIPDSYMSGILFGKVEVTFSIDQENIAGRKVRDFSYMSAPASFITK